MKFKISKDVLWKVVDDEVVIVKPESDSYMYLNATGTEIWKMIDQGIDVEKMIDEISKKYEAPIATIEKDTKKVLEDLVNSAVIKPAK